MAEPFIWPNSEERSGGVSSSTEGSRLSRSDSRAELGQAAEFRASEFGGSAFAMLPEDDIATKIIQNTINGINATFNTLGNLFKHSTTQKLPPVQSLAVSEQVDRSAQNQIWTSDRVVIESTRQPEKASNENLQLTLEMLQARREFGIGGLSLFQQASLGSEAATVALFQKNSTASLSDPFYPLQKLVSSDPIGGLAYIADEGLSNATPTRLVTAILTDTTLQLPPLTSNGVSNKSTITQEWLRELASVGLLPRLLLESKFYSQRGVLDLCTLQDNVRSTDAVLAGAKSTLSQLILAMQLLMPQAEFTLLADRIKRDTLTQTLNFVEQRAVSFTNAEFQWLFNQFPKEVFDVTDSRFKDLQDLSFKVGFDATESAVASLSIPNLVRLIGLQSSFTHFSPYLTESNFAKLPSILGPLSPITLAVAQAISTQNTEIFSSLNAFTASAGT